MLANVDAPVTATVDAKLAPPITPSVELTVAVLSEDKPVTLSVPFIVTPAPPSVTANLPLSTLIPPLKVPIPVEVSVVITVREANVEAPALSVEASATAPEALTPANCEAPKT